MSIVNNVNNMQIGDLIPCKYIAEKNKFGQFSEIGVCSSEEINNLENPDGKFYFEKVDNNLLIADRIIQNNISWNELNNNKLIDGFTIGQSKIEMLDVNDKISNENTNDYSMIEYNNYLYICWCQLNNQIIVNQYDNQTNTMTRIYYFSVASSSYLTSPVLIVYNDYLYLCYRYKYSSKTMIKMIRFESNNYITISDRINDSIEDVSNICLNVYNGELYILWMQSNLIKAKKYDEKQFTVVTEGINMFNCSCNNLKTDVYNNKLYMSWNEKYKIVMMNYNGDKFEIVSDNISDLDGVTNSYLKNYNGSIYCYFTYLDSLNIRRLMVKKYNNESWSTLNDFPIMTLNITDACSYIFNGELYITCTVKDKKNLITLYKYSNNNWIEVAKTINYLNSHCANSIVCEYNGELYIAWREYSSVSGGTAYLLKMKKLHVEKQMCYSICTNNQYKKYIINNKEQTFMWCKDSIDVNNRIIINNNRNENMNYLTKSNDIGFRPVLIIK